MNLSDVFKFTQGLGQKGHQIGRKVGDAIELMTLGMVNLDENLTKYLVIEDGVEGATSAKHKVEFSFYKLENNLPTKVSTDLFGLIECKKVGVEQTTKQNFKSWKSKSVNKKDFYQTDGYDFTISPSGTDFKWAIQVQGLAGNNNAKITVVRKQTDLDDVTTEFSFNCQINSQILIAVDENLELHVLGPNSLLSTIKGSLHKCIIIQIEELDNNNIKKINVNESLPGPQTPEKAKQASFVSLDVRKKVLGQFDKTDNKSFVSILVIGEASHWEEKSRSMIRLCNDYNLIVPDKVLVYLFSKFEEKFGEDYQDLITKTNYKDSLPIRNLVLEIITHFDKKILQDMETNEFVCFKHKVVNGTNRLELEPIR